MSFVDEVVNSSAANSGREFLEHYGVKGMKWGQRRARPTTAVTTETRVNRGIRANKTKVKAKGGQAQPASEDAVKAAVQKQKLKKSGPAALSNKELQELATRIQLEKQVTQLTATKGKKVVARTLGNTGQQQLQRVSNEAGGKAVDAALSKRR